MNGAIIDTTFGFIAARAARYPVIVKNSQVRPILRKSPGEPIPEDSGIQWLLLNARLTNRMLKGTA